MSEYLNTVKRLEPDITPIDLAGGIASIAISLKRLADNTKPKSQLLDMDKARTIINNYLKEAGCINDWDADELLGQILECIQ